MIKNCQHNLIHQLSETMDSLWRIEQYKEDAREENCRDDEEFWEQFKETLEKQVEMLKIQLESTIKEGGLQVY